jgi:hypothetical protein
MRGFCFALAAGLAGLWLLGLVGHATPWLVWLNGLGALTTVVLALGSMAEEERYTLEAGGLEAIGVGLIALWIVGLATHATPWLTWLTLIAACGFLAVGAIGLTGRLEEPAHQPTQRFTPPIV